MEDLTTKQLKMERLLLGKEKKRQQDRADKKQKEIERLQMELEKLTLELSSLREENFDLRQQCQGLRAELASVRAMKESHEEFLQLKKQLEEEWSENEKE